MKYCFEKYVFGETLFFGEIIFLPREMVFPCISDIYILIFFSGGCSLFGAIFS